MACKIATLAVSILVSFQAAASDLSCEVAATGVNAQLTELARFYLEVQAMEEESTDKSHALVDLKKKHRELARAIGAGFKQAFDAEVTRLRAGFESEKTERDTTTREQRERQRDQVDTLLKWTRHHDHKINGFQPQQLGFVSEDVIVTIKENILVFYNLKTKEPFETITVFGGKINAESRIIVTKDSQTVYVAGYETLYKFDLANPKAPSTSIPLGEDFRPATIALSPNEDFLAIGASGSTLALVDTKEFKLKTSYAPGVNQTDSIYFSDSGKYVLGNARSGYQVIFNTQTGQRIAFDENSKESDWKDAVFIPGQEKILLIGTRGEVYTYDPATQQYAKTLIEWNDAANIRLSTNGETVILSRRKVDTVTVTNGHMMWSDPRNFALFDFKTGEDLNIESPEHSKAMDLKGENAHFIVYITNPEAKDDGSEDAGFVLNKRTLKTAPIRVKYDLKRHLRSVSAGNIFLSPSGERMIYAGDRFNSVMLEVW